ncbi:MAG: polysaccharide deacetylase family protein [Odoribacteraceae bacterium]|nr:polysaccharide deacetylase family protein [Odoribacteraceae bacterium]
MTAFSYFLDNFKLFFTTGGVAIDYGAGGTAPVMIRRQADDAFYASGADFDPRRVSWREWRGESIPFLLGDDGDGEIVSAEDGRVEIRVDIVFSAFYFLSGRGELARGRRDSLGRVPYEGSAIQELGIVQLPVVSYYFDILATALERAGVRRRGCAWGDHPFAVTLTHDIDTCRRGWIEGSFDALKRGRPLAIPRLVSRRLAGRDVWFNFDAIMDADEGAGARSSFYFLPRRGSVGGKRNADYNIDNARVREAMAGIERRGHEVGVHGSFGTHADADALAREARSVCREGVAGGRFHFLMFDPVESVGVLSRAGLRYDTTLGFADRPGFRRGTCLPFFLFDFKTGATSPVLEIPLAVMDATLRGYARMGTGEAFDAIAALVERVRSAGGVFTVLWHNTFFSSYKYAGWREVYDKLLASAGGALFLNGREIHERLVGK